MSRFAENTEVSSEKSRMEIERTLTRYGATAFAYGWQEGQSVISFEAHGRRIRFNLPMPDRDSREFTHTAEQKLKRSAKGVEKFYEQAVRQRWRALALVVKAKLEAVASGIVEFEDEFLAHIVLPSGQDVGSWLRPQIESAYQHKKMPPLLGYKGDAA